MMEQKEKFILELKNYMENIPEYSMGQIIYSLLNKVGKKSNLLEISDKDMTILLERAQQTETELY